MRILSVFLSLVLLSSVGNANFGVGLSVCGWRLQQILMEGMSSEEAPLSIGIDGAVSISMRERIVSRRTESNGTQVITYRVSGEGARSSQGGRAEPTRTLRITTADGRLTRVVKEIGAGTGSVIRQDLTFTHSGSKCELQQEEYSMTAPAKDAVNAVTFDKVLCDRIEPQLRSMGTQAASQCGGLFATVEQALRRRAGELERGNQTLVTGVDPRGTPVLMTAEMMGLLNVLQACNSNGLSSFFGGMGLINGMLMQSAPRLESPSTGAGEPRSIPTSAPAAR